MSPRLEKKLRLCPDLPSIPDIAIELVALAEQSDVDLNSFTRLISEDPALAAKFLRVANSSLYGRSGQVRDLKSAMHVLGIHTAITLGLSFALAENARNHQFSGLDLTRFWRRSMLSAVAAQLLGEIYLPESRDSLFLAGLIQDYGCLALSAIEPEQYGAIESESLSHEALAPVERNRLGIDHVEAGVWLACYWRLPEFLAQGIENSHNRLGSRAEQKAALFNSCVAVSGRIADIYLESDSKSAITNAQFVANACLGMGEADLLYLLDRFASYLPEIESVFDMHLLSRSEAQGLSDRARELMLLRQTQRMADADSATVEKDNFKRLADDLYEAAYYDALTGVYNRRYFDDVAASMFEEAGGQRQPLSLVYLDLDYFKEINDTHGHQAGDLILKNIADAIQQCLRPRDLLARYGGEEFVILLPSLDETAALSVVDRVRVAVENQSLRLPDGQELRVTISGGIATYNNAMHGRRTLADLVAAADDALYRAKQLGRNRIVQAD